MRADRAAWPFVAMDQAILDRAVAVQDALAERSNQRGAKIADLLIAAAAETAGLVVLHYDHDFDLIATVTNQPTEWILPARTVPWDGPSALDAGRRVGKMARPVVAAASSCISGVVCE